MRVVLHLPVIFLLLSLPCTHNVKLRMDPSERETLFLVMESLSSDRKWRTSNPDPCTLPWPGIECKAGSDNRIHVSRLDFGTPTSPSCRKSATFPAIVFNLPFLHSLFFLNCFTVTKTAFSIPLRPPGTSLQKLVLKSNPALIGPIPPHISTLTSLQLLTLSQNCLTGRIPPAISLLESLIHLDLSYNFLTGAIPTQLGELGSLADLDLSYNSLTGPIPQSIGQLTLLQKLDLSSNSLSGRVPETVQSLVSLSLLALSSNKLTGKFPDGLAKLRSLQYLIMDDNPMFVPLPPQLGSLARLRELRLANSGYSGQIPGSFVWLTNLTTLSLENNRLTGEIPPALSGLSRLYHLNLSRNLLGGAVPFSAGFFRRLGRNLDLSGNAGLCLRGSERDEGYNVGVEVCGANRSESSLKHANSGGAASLLSMQLLGYLGICGLYNWLV